MMSWCTRSGTARCHATGRGVKVRSQSAIEASGIQAEAMCSVVVAVGSGASSGPAVKRIGMIWKSWTSLAGRSPRAPGSVSRFVAMSRPAAEASEARAAFSSTPRAATSAPRRAPRGASRMAWRCSSLRRAAMACGMGSCAVTMALPVRAPRLLDVLLQGHRGVGQLARVPEELLQLVPAAHALDRLVRVLGALGGREHVGPQEEQELGALGLVVAVAEQVADDGDLEEDAEPLAVQRAGRALEAAEHDQLVAHRVHEGGGLAVVDRGLRVAVDRDRRALVVDRLV